ncbi:MAG: oxidoreductase [Pelagibacterales bacterium]|nr:oxidoreductase [Pelagibacterales bacterium]OUU61186.1 MAG: hypothetical protein CBC22_08140 [Alphaproteobacteria bacterium TMED62]|tara:strand:- start:2528 stop:3286 length:759 start_codon:yes stop_codon:yes gene_type:complete
MKKNIVSKVAIVTGASKGLGAETCIKLAKEKYKVAIIYKSSVNEAKNILLQCEKFSSALLIKADVSKKKSCEKIVNIVRKKLGEINILINNAGKTKFVKFTNLDGLNENDFLDIYRTNVISAFLMSRACHKSMLKTLHPKIINISSVASLGLGSSIAYACSKGALNTLSLSLARTMSPKITVNTISPGYIKTSWHGSKKQVVKKAKIYEKQVMLKRSAAPEEVADIVMWYVKNPHLITGENIFVDGGLHLSS